MSLTDHEIKLAKYRLRKEVWIPLSDCKHNFLYNITARNATFGIFNETENCFWIARTKFGSTFLDMEYHWDTGEPHGTAKPNVKLFSTNFEFDINNSKMLDFLKTYK